MELEGRFITSKDDRLPIESGIRPEIELDPSSRVCKDDKFPNSGYDARTPALTFVQSQLNDFSGQQRKNQVVVARRTRFLLQTKPRFL
ncbi:hypothetical protein E3N88_12942 [Mikania micrantha]|uniref:Uncharacterized protein n=1 Tax=Mikania micrantha TaxID=192012 RepID=A0A5N6P7C6_9ASTR|nr:hypothetical protein E3N88_12827 [Mikania micrantha]KAD5961469.1 hypothetical protein E3N88_12942 [Mikania micrantha]